MVIKAVIFDCFGVLYVDPSLRFYEANVKDFHRLQAALLDIDKQCDYGLIDDVEHDRLVAELTGLEYEFVHANIRGEHVLNQELLAYSQGLRPRYKVGMLSNVGRGGMQSFFSEEESQRYFDAAVLSSDIGAVKPSREAFITTADRLGLATNECIMVDDRKDNVDGARAAGMEAVLYQTNGQCIAALEALLEGDDAGTA